MKMLSSNKFHLVGIIGNIVLYAHLKCLQELLGNRERWFPMRFIPSDVFATFIAFLGVRNVKKGADKAHPYGHERIECIASLILGLVLLVTGLELVRLVYRIFFREL